MRKQRLSRWDGAPGGGRGLFFVAGGGGGALVPGTSSTLNLYPEFPSQGYGDR